MSEASSSSARIIVGLTGGIACYKVASVVSSLVQNGIASGSGGSGGSGSGGGEGAEVTVCMTDAATRFVTPLTFQALSGRPVYTDQWQHIESNDPQHISLAQRCDCMLIAPCSMDMLSRLATGRTDDVVSLVAAAIDRERTPVLLAPSMNAVMWAQPATQRNLRTLREDGFHIIEPGVGWQACRTSGPGRLPEPQALLEEIRRALASGKK